jgi:lambda family phage tail tape measure protein
LGLASELEGIRKLADAYAYANEKQREKIQRDYDLIHSSEETKKITEEVARIQTSAQNEIIKLEEKRKTLTPKQQRAGEGAVIDETIAKIKKQSEVDTIAAVKLIDNNEARKRSMDELLKFYDRQEKFGEIQVGLNDRLKESQFQGTLIGKGELSKQYLQITENARQLTLTLGRLIAAQYTEEDLQDPQKAQEYADRLSAIAESVGQITEQQTKNLENSRLWNAGWTEAFTNFAANAENAAKQAKGYFDAFTKGVEDAIVRFVKTGKLSFKDLANSLIEQFVRIQVQQSLTALGGSLGMGTPGSGVAGLLKAGASFLGFSGFAAGGAVGANSPIVVGERGPELFIPQSAGNIVPNSAISSGGSGLGTTIVNYNISAVDASSFRSLVARDPSFIYAVTEQGRRSQPSRRLTA